MRSRDTSREAWKLVAESGLLGGKHLTIYEMVGRYPDCTANEIFLKLKYLGKIRGEFDSNTHSRFTELRDMGCIEEVQRRPCSTSGRLAVTWEVTGRHPIENWRQVAKGKGRRPLEDTILDLKEEIRDLQADNARLRKHLQVARTKRRARRKPIIKKKQLRLT